MLSANRRHERPFQESKLQFPCRATDIEEMSRSVNADTKTDVICG
jgi:hypothetical protein